MHTALYGSHSSAFSSLQHYFPAAEESFSVEGWTCANQPGGINVVRFAVFVGICRKRARAEMSGLKRFISHPDIIIAGQRSLSRS